MNTSYLKHRASTSIKTALCAVAGLVIATSLTLTSQAVVVYSVDDGAANTNLSTGSGAPQTFANQFTAVAGGETIQNIMIAWGAVFNGTPFTARLWSDPNGDGNPSDAIQLSSLASTVTLQGTSTFVLYDIPDVTLSVGQSFFVGFTITAPTGFPAALDTTPPISNQSWATSGADFPGSGLFNVGTSFFNGDLMIRANGVASVVPEPGTWVMGVSLLAVAAAPLLRRKRS